MDPGPFPSPHNEHSAKKSEATDSAADLLARSASLRSQQKQQQQQQQQQHPLQDQLLPQVVLSLENDSGSR